MKKQKTQKTNKGITLIALVITIIVMLILVAVTITMAVNGGLFEYAGNASTQTNKAIEAEQTLANGRVKIENTWYDSIDDYLANKPSTNQGETTEEPGTSTQILTLTGEAEVDVKSTITLVAKLNNEEVSANNIQWTSSKPEVATVENGVVTGVNSSKGTTIITATYIPDNTLIVTKEITVNPKYLGDCTNCNNGYIEGFLCPECSTINKEFNYLCNAHCAGCEKDYSEVTEDYICPRGCDKKFMSMVEIYKYKFSDCGHYFGIDMYDYINLENTHFECSSCTDGNLYDEGN